jgi:hypothetical protein
VHEIGDIIMRLIARRVASEFRIIDKGRIVSAGPITSLTV